MTDNYQKCVVCIFWFDGKVMLTKRLKSKFWQDHYGVVSGKMEKGEDIYEAMQREIREETGLFCPKENLKLLDCCIDNEKQEKAFIFQTVWPTYCFSSVQNPEPDKHSPWALFTKKQVMSMKLIPRIKKFIKATKLKSLEAI